MSFESKITDKEASFAVVLWFDVFDRNSFESVDIKNKTKQFK